MAAGILPGVRRADAREGKMTREMKHHMAYADAERRRPPGIERMIAEVAARYEVTRSQILGPRKYQHNVAARADLAQQLRRSGKSLPEIGRLLGRHHTTVMHLLRMKRRESSPVTEMDAFEADESGIWAI